MGVWAGRGTHFSVLCVRGLEHGQWFLRFPVPNQDVVVKTAQLRPDRRCLPVSALSPFQSLFTGQTTFRGSDEKNAGVPGSPLLWEPLRAETGAWGVQTQHGTAPRVLGTGQETACLPLDAPAE